MLKLMLMVALTLQAGQREELRVYLRSGQILRGDLGTWNTESFDLRQGKSTRTIRWEQLEGQQSRLVYERYFNPSDGKAMLLLAEVAWGFNNKDFTRLITLKTLELDPSLQADFDKVTSVAPGKFLPGRSTTRPAPGAAPPVVSSGKYRPATPEQHAKAIDDARRTAAGVADELGVKFAEIQTDHFLIFTDWDPRDHPFLKQNLEDSYALVSRQFEMSPRDNIFIGKLPVYMYASKQVYIKHTVAVDMKPDLAFTLGYYGQSSAGTGRMVMWKPVAEGKTTLDQARREWARTLTHEFVHAFFGRYRSNVHIPSWLNEGTAEVIAEQVYKRETARAWARHHAQETADVSMIFSDQIKSGDMYPVMMSMVECLIAQDRAAFIRMFDLIKDGAKPEDALRQCYGIDYKGLDKAWRRHALTH
jgi:hypothetical protein